jgi:UDPglucose--hexose-1-phosphate uridylyltransferase
MSQAIKSEIRKDYIQEKYVIIAPLRGKRPRFTDQLNYDLDWHHQAPHDKDCPFCSVNLGLAKLVVGTKKSWQIVVLPNKYPALTLTNKKAYGQQEVVIETPWHNMHLEDLSVNTVAEVLKVYADRTKTMMGNHKMEYILIFKNNGGRAGASIQHAHSQIFATSFLPPHLADKSQRVQEYKLRIGRCVYCDVIKKELSGPRLVYKDKYVVAFTPYASVYNYELWLMPRRHLDNITNLNNQERNSLAHILKRVLGKISHQLKLPYNYYFHQVVHDDNEHLYLKITPRGTSWAGVEIGSGLIINPISPEMAAKFYRK